MIKFSLHCDAGHEFEGWFSGNDEFDDQKARGLITCPLCDSAQVSKSLMAPSVSTSRKKQANLAQDAANNGNDVHSSGVSQPAPSTLASVPALPPEMVEKFRELREHVKANSEDVGDKFSEEARKIHYGESEKRGIYGQAKPEEVKELVEEGVEIVPLPSLPEDKN